MIQRWLAACAVLAGIRIACSLAATRPFFAAIRLAVSSASCRLFLYIVKLICLSSEAHYTYVLVYYVVATTKSFACSRVVGGLLLTESPSSETESILILFIDDGRERTAASPDSAV